MAAARLLHEQDKLYAAQEHFDEAFTRFPSLISDFDIDLFLELLLMQVSRLFSRISLFTKSKPC